MPLSRVTFARGLAAFAIAGALQGCSPSVEQQTNDLRATLQAPSRDAFPDVGNALQLRCATLDCHGQVGRNLRLYGFGGLRLSPTDNPIGNPTTDQEFATSYESLVGLEPETLSGVVTLRLDPDQLSLVRKIRGIERHKGGQLVHPGDSLDRCIVLWLIGKPDPTPCNDVSDTPGPGTN